MWIKVKYDFGIHVLKRDRRLCKVLFACILHWKNNIMQNALQLFEQCLKGNYIQSINVKWKVLQTENRKGIQNWQSNSHKMELLEEWIPLSWTKNVHWCRVGFEINDFWAKVMTIATCLQNIFSTISRPQVTLEEEMSEVKEELISLCKFGHKSISSCCKIRSWMYVLILKLRCMLCHMNLSKTSMNHNIPRPSK